MSYEYLPLLLLALPVCYWLVQRLRARRRRSLANIYGAGFYLSVKQPQHRENVRRMG